MRLLVVVALAMLQLFTARAQADTTTAKVAFDQGDKLTLQGKWAEACPFFEASFKADPQLGALLALAECHEQINRIASAWSELKDALVIATQRNDPRKKDIEIAIKELEPKVPKLKLTPPPRIIPGLTVKRDGNDVTLLVGTEIPTDAGEHEVLTEAPDFDSQTQKVTLEAGKVTTLELPALEKATTPPVKTDGILKIKTAANAQIILDSKVVGTGSFEGPVKAGGHTLRIVAGGMRPYQAEVTVAVDETRVMDIPLDPEVSNVVIVPASVDSGPSFEVGIGFATGVKNRADKPALVAVRLELALRLGKRVNLGAFVEAASIDTGNKCGLDMAGPFPATEFDTGVHNQFISCRYLMPGAQLLVHILPGKKIDPYVGVTPGFRFGFITWREYYGGTPNMRENSDWLPGIVGGFRVGVNYHPRPSMKGWEVGGYFETAVTFAGDETGYNHDSGPSSYVTFFGGLRTSLQF